MARGKAGAGSAAGTRRPGLRGRGSLGARGSVVVPVPVVRGVPVSVVGVVDVVAVHDGGVSAGVTVLVRVTAVRDVLAGLALVPVSGVLPVEVSVVRVVDVVAVREPGMAAGGAMGVRVRGVLVVENGHEAHLWCDSWRSVALQASPRDPVRPGLSPHAAPPARVVPGLRRRRPDQRVGV